MEAWQPRRATYDLLEWEEHGLNREVIQSQACHPSGTSLFLNEGESEVIGLDAVVSNFFHVVAVVGELIRFLGLRIRFEAANEVRSRRQKESQSDATKHWQL